MNDLLKIESIGVTAGRNPNRGRKGGEVYSHLLPPPDWHETVVRRNATVTEVVQEIIKLINKRKGQTKKIANELIGKDIQETCNKIWDFLFDHIKYKEDDYGEEQLRTPAVSWAQRRTRGIDCDDFSIFASCILSCLNITNTLRIARYEGKDYFQHIYVVVPQGEKFIYVDAVLDEFNAEKEPVEIKDFTVMETNNLKGINVKVLSGLDETALDELAGILFGTDFEEIFTMDGTAGEEKELSAIYNHLVRTRNAIANNPKMIEHAQDPATFLKMIDYAIQYWNTDKRDEALRILSENEDKINQLNGLGGVEDYEELQLYFGNVGSDKLEALGKIKAVQKFFTKVKETVQKVGEGIKNVAKSVIKYNPLSLTARAGILVALKTNAFHIAEHLKWGYLTEAEARQLGFDMAEWQKTRQQLQNAEKVFTDLQGEASKFKEAMLTGKAGGLSGVSFGVVAATATAGAAATAAPFIAKIASFVKGIDLKKLLSKVNPLELLKKKKQAEKPAAALPAKSSIPDKQENASEAAETNERTTEAKNNLPATNETEPPPPPPPADDKNFLQKSVDWVKEHPGTSILIAGGLVLALFPGARQAVGLGSIDGVKRKRRKNNKKKKTPNVLTGVPKKAGKKRRNKKRGKAGKRKTKVVKL